MRASLDACGCFPTGRHYPGIAHLLKAVIRGVAEGFAQDAPWDDLEIAVIDTETTGRDASVDRVVELGICVGRAGEVVARYNWLINPGMPIPAQARDVHGIGDEDVKDAPRFGEIAAEVAAALKGRLPCAYNAAFDKSFVLTEIARLPTAIDATGVPALKREVEWVDPLVWARELQQGEKSRALGEVAARLGIVMEKAHRASEDAEAALKVLYALAKDGRVPRAYGALVQEQRRLAFEQADERRRWRAPS